MNLLSYFPKSTLPYPVQSEAIPKIEAAFKAGKKFVFLGAPTGSGKSFIGKTLGNASADVPQEFIDLIKSNRAFEQDQFGEFKYSDECENHEPFGAIVLTTTKGLQDQYLAQFEDTGVMKGKSNYICAVDPKLDVDIAPCVFLPDLKESCLQKCICPYYNARNEALSSKFTALNYSMFMSTPDHVKHREYLICDEASELNMEIVKRFSREIEYKTLSKLDIDPKLAPVKDYTKFRVWLSQYVDALTSEIDAIQQKFKKKKSDVTVVERQRLSMYKTIKLSIMTTLDTWSECEYLIERKEDSITIKPLRVDTLSKYIFDFAEKVLLMSATFVDIESTAKKLGITDYEYIEVKSTFDPKNAPIFCIGKNKLNFKNLQAALPTVAKQIKEICNMHKDVKGIIHTHTSAITQYLDEHIGDSRFLVRNKHTSNEQIIAQHIESPDPTILMSPSLTFGTDLKDDLARFQVIVKAAYMPLGDEWVKRLASEDRTWYENQMLCSLVQACGRGVRSPDDHCVTYIIDACITEAVVRSRSRLPKYFLARFQ